MNTDQSLLSMTLSSTRSEIPRVNDFAERVNDFVQMGKKRFNSFQLALSEAVSNAIVHGNKEDKSKKVQIVAWLENSDLYISVEDEGEGFDPSDVPDPLEDQNLLKEGGRGVFLMRQYADDIEFKEDGSKVILIFNTNQENK